MVPRTCDDESSVVARPLELSIIRGGEAQLLHLTPQLHEGVTRRDGILLVDRDRCQERHVRGVAQLS